MTLVLYKCLYMLIPAEYVMCMGVSATRHFECLDMSTGKRWTGLIGDMPCV